MIFLKSVNKSELLVPILGMVSLLTACFIVCAKKYFLDDELISFILVTDPSLFHMLRALADQVDVSPPFYYVLAWLWARVFGASEISLRIISSLGMGLAFFITWRVIRPTFGLWATSLGITGAFFLSLLVFEHNAQARFYGLFMAVGALALLQYERFNRNGLACSWKDFFSNMGIHGSLVLTHNFGLLYSGIFLLAYILAGTYKKVFAPKVYLSVILGWLAFWLWLVPFLHQAEVGKLHSWIPVPGYREFLLSFSHGIMISLFIPLIVLLSWFISTNAAFGKDKVSKFNSSPSSFPLLILGALLVVLPPIPTWIISRTVISVFADKYMILSTLGWSILLSWLTWRALPPLDEPDPGDTWRTIFFGNRQKAVLALLICSLFLVPNFLSLLRKSEPRPGIAEEHLLGGLPIVVESWDIYLSRFVYSPAKNRYYYILDWDVTINNDRELNAVDSFYSMSALKRNYPFVNIVQGNNFLKDHERFLVLYNKLNQWFDIRIKNNIFFKVTILKEDLFLVERNK